MELKSPFLRLQQGSFDTCKRPTHTWIRDLEDFKNERVKNFKELTPFQKLLYIIDLPFIVVARLTIPPAIEAHYSKTICTLCICPSILFNALVINDFHF